MSGSPSLQDLANLPSRLDRLEAELHELRQHLGSLEAPPPLTVRQFCDRYGWTENQLRWLLFHRHTNGLAEAVSGTGRLLIDAPLGSSRSSREIPTPRQHVFGGRNRKKDGSIH
jgi:hypothetical protein